MFRQGLEGLSDLVETSSGIMHAVLHSLCEYSKHETQLSNLQRAGGARLSSDVIPRLNRGGVYNMAESCAPLLDGGYEAEFAESVPDSLSCSICLLPFRNPHLVSCCGAKFCEICINRVKTVGQPCPLCKQEFVSLIDRSFQRKVLELNVRCSRNKDGCQWVGELRHLVQHEKEECVWVVIECSYQCGARLPRKLMAEHEQEKCPQRPTDVKIDKFIKRIEERHTREMRIMEKKIAEQDKKIKVC